MSLQSAPAFFATYFLYFPDECQGFTSWDWITSEHINHLLCTHCVLNGLLESEFLKKLVLLCSENAPFLWVSFAVCPPESHSYSVLSEASPGWKSLNSLNFVLRLTASEDVFGIVSLVLNHCLSSPKLNVVSDDRQSIKSHQLSVGKQRFPFLSGSRFVHALMCWLAQRSVRKQRNGVCGGGKQRG